MFLFFFTTKIVASQAQISCIAQAGNPLKCPADTIEYNQLFYFQLLTWDELNFNNPANLQLYVNDVALPYYPCIGVNRESKKIFFKFESRKDISNNSQKTIIDLIRRDFGYATKNQIPLQFGFGTRDGKIVYTYKPPSQSINFYFFNGLKAILVAIFAIICFILAFVVLNNKNAFNERVNDTYIEKKSLRKFQLAFWTLVIAFSYFSLWIILGDTPILPESVIGLFSISLGTTFISSLIPQKFSASALAPGKKGLKGLLTDGDNDFTVAKLQFWVFTIILGVIFIYTAVMELRIYNFTTQELVLMGVSAGGYLGNKAVKAYT